MSETEELAEALDDLIMSKGVALDDDRLDWLTDFIAARETEAVRRHLSEKKARIDAAKVPARPRPARVTHYLTSQGAIHTVENVRQFYGTPWWDRVTCEKCLTMRPALTPAPAPDDAEGEG